MIIILAAGFKNYYHSLANKFFDYTEAGLPSLNMNFPEYKKCNEEYEVSILLNELSVEKISEALTILLNNVQFYERLKTNCLQAREVWNWKLEKEKLISVFKALS